VDVLKPTVLTHAFLFGLVAEAEAILHLGIALLGLKPKRLAPTTWPTLIRLHFLLAECLAFRDAHSQAHESFNTGLELINQASIHDGRLRDVLFSVPEVVTVVFEDAGRYDDAIKLDDLIAGVLPRIKEEPNATRREAVRMISHARLDDAERLLMFLLHDYKDWYEDSSVFAVPDNFLDSIRRGLGLLVRVLELRGRPKGLALAEEMKAELNECRLIDDALRTSLLVETRDQAMQGILNERQRPIRKKWGSFTRVNSGIAAATPLSPAALKGADGNDSYCGDLCSICCLDMEEEESADLLLCGHSFHHTCLSLWSKKCPISGATCPLCRAKIRRRRR